MNVVQSDNLAADVLNVFRNSCVAAIASTSRKLIAAAADMFPLTALWCGCVGLTESQKTLR